MPLATFHLDLLVDLDTGENQPPARQCNIDEMQPYGNVVDYAL